MVGVGVGGIDETGGFGLREGTWVGITVGWPIKSSRVRYTIEKTDALCHFIIF